MPKSEETPLHTCARWVAVGAFEDPGLLASALRELDATGFRASDLCLAGMGDAIRKLAGYSNGSHLGPLRVLLDGMVETRVPGGDVPILASRGCAGEAASIPALEEIMGRMRQQVVRGAIMLAVLARSAAELATAGRVLLRHSSYRVHTFEYAPKQVQ
jgi:hypothetical protein